MSRPARAAVLPAEAIQIFQLIEDGQRRNGRPPTIKELTEELELPRKTVQRYLGMLVDAGFIKRGRREIRLVESR